MSFEVPNFFFKLASCSSDSWCSLTLLENPHLLRLLTRWDDGTSQTTQAIHVTPGLSVYGHISPAVALSSSHRWICQRTPRRLGRDRDFDAAIHMSGRVTYHERGWAPRGIH